ncbi:MAG: putative toxin-antitoxin system toxin component, PIN family [Candidatus Limnocylindrales bacterium]
MRAVLDANVLMSALLSPEGPPARLIRAWRSGAFELVVSPLLLTELHRALSYPKLRRLVTAKEGDAFVALLGREAVMVSDPAISPPVRSTDPNDDYLLVLAAAEQAVIVTGAKDLPALADRAPIHAPTAFLAILGRSTD